MDYEKYCDLLDEGKIKVNFNGHAVRVVEKDFRPLLYRQTCCSIKDMKSRIEAGLPLNSDLEFPVVMESSYSFQCGRCGKMPTVTIYEDRIEFEDDHVEPQAFSVDIDFPTGDMVFNDTYPDCFEHGDFDGNTVAGVQECSEAMAKQGLMYFFVGNSCPAVWKEGDTIYVGSLPEDQWDDRNGSICTDLWWASFVDPNTVLNRDCDAQKEVDHMREKGGSLKVTPGTYRCTSYYHLGGLDYSETEKQVFCKLELINE